MLSPGKLGLLVFCAAGALVAQKVVSARAGMISFVQGSAFVNGKRVFLKATRFPQMRDGEILSTSRGRAELLLAPGAILRLAENSQVRMEATRLSDTRIALQRGEALIEIVQLAEGSQIQLELADSTTEFTRSGLYQFGKSQNATMPSNLRVYGGEALVRSGLKTALVKRGFAVNLDSGMEVSRFDRKQTDLLHAWAARRSFELFMGDPEARRKQTHWQIEPGGYVENKNFDVEFRANIRRPQPVRSISPAIPRAESR